MQDNAITPEQLTAQRRAAGAFAETASIMARLRRVPDGCPWDLQQTLDSIQPHTLEEVYEVFDAIDRRDWTGLQDELGDLLLQVLFYAQIAKDEGRFDIADVAQGLSAKLLRRHPHIFGDVQAETPEAVIATWEKVKQTEKTSNAASAGLLDGLTPGMPALVEARKIGSRVAKIGFDWPDAQGVFEKIDEEIAEIRAELNEAPDNARIEEEVGDLLFTVASLARHLKVDPEQALRRANAKFRRRFTAMEQGAGKPLEQTSAGELEALWAQAKSREKQT